MSNEIIIMSVIFCTIGFIAGWVLAWVFGAFDKLSDPEIQRLIAMNK